MPQPAAKQRHAWIIVTGIIITLPAAANGSETFDGSWNVVIDCPPTANAVKAYQWSFPAQVQNGTLTGQYNTIGATPSGTLTGHIKPNGAAVLLMTGITGDSRHNLGRVSAGLPFRYTVNAHFTASAGSGRRNSGRDCSFTFSRG